MKVDLDELERKARAATPGLWSPGEDPDDGEVWDGVKLVVHRIGRAPITGNTEHVAANSPPVTLALIARIRELESFARQLIHDHVRDVDETEMHELLDKGAVMP